jgi:hypothetical protein
VVIARDNWNPNDNTYINKRQKNPAQIRFFSKKPCSDSLLLKKTLLRFASSKIKPAQIRFFSKRP